MNENKLIYILLGLVLIVGALIAFPLFFHLEGKAKTDLMLIRQLLKTEARRKSLRLILLVSVM